MEYSNHSKASAQKKILDQKSGLTKKYRNIFVGQVSLLYLIKYELIMTLFSPIPGALGLVLRKIFFPRLFKKTGKNIIFGRNMTIRHAYKIEIGNNVILDDNSVIDAKGENNRGIKIGHNVFIGRNTLISCKEGDIEIGDFSNIGANTYLISESILKIGKYVFIAGNGYLVAGGNHSFKEKETPIMLQPSVSKGGIIIEDNIWIGATVTILDGVKIETGSVIGAAALVNKNIPAYSIAYGVPVKITSKRK